MIETALLKGKNFPGKVANVLLYGVDAWFQYGSLGAAFCASAGMVVGQAPGWRQYISAIRRDGTLNDHSRLWGVACLSLRGALWGVCLTAGGFAAAWVGGFHVEHWAIYAYDNIVLGGSQGVVYWGVVALYDKTRMAETGWFNDWTVAEMVHGLLLWTPQVLMIYFCA